MAGPTPVDSVEGNIQSRGREFRVISLPRVTGRAIVTSKRIIGMRNAPTPCLQGEHRRARSFCFLILLDQGEWAGAHNCNSRVPVFPLQSRGREFRVISLPRVTGRAIVTSKRIIRPARFLFDTV